MINIPMKTKEISASLPNPLIFPTIVRIKYDTMHPTKEIISHIVVAANFLIGEAAVASANSVIVMNCIRNIQGYTVRTAPANDRFEVIRNIGPHIKQTKAIIIVFFASLYNIASFKHLTNLVIITLSCLLKSKADSE